MIRNLIMGALVVVGMIAVSLAKIRYQKRQVKTPDNQYSVQEKTILYAGYACMALAFIIAAFIDF